MYLLNMAITEANRVDPDEVINDAFRKKGGGGGGENTLHIS